MAEAEEDLFDPEYRDLCEAIGMMAERADVETEMLLQALASTALRVLAFQTGSSEEAYALRDMFCGTVHHGFRGLDEAGVPVWSKARMN